MAILSNLGSEDFVIKPGDRIAQFVIEAIITPEPVFVDELSGTTRSDRGLWQYCSTK